MAKYKSQYKELMFFAGGVMRQFNEGVYETVDKKEIEVLDNEGLATRIEEEKPKAKSKAK